MSKHRNNLEVLALALNASTTETTTEALFHEDGYDLSDYSADDGWVVERGEADGVTVVKATRTVTTLVGEKYDDSRTETYIFAVEYLGEGDATTERWWSFTIDGREGE